MIVETIILKSRVTKLEVVAHYSGNYNYGLYIGESCYASTINYNGLEYVVCVNKDYDMINKISNMITEELGFPLAINIVTKMRDGKCNIVRKSVCVNAFNKSIHDDMNLDDYIISDVDDLYYDMMDFNLTDKDWSK